MFYDTTLRGASYSWIFSLDYEGVGVKLMFVVKPLIIGLVLHPFVTQATQQL